MTACSTNRGGSEYSTATYSGSPVVTVNPNTPMPRLRTDITDTGPGTPVGDRTSADPSETSSQGAGSRNLVGQPAGPPTTGVEESTATVQTPPPAPAPAAAPVTQAPPPTLTRNGNDVVIPLYRESARVGKREVDAGTVRIHKYVRTETVNQPVQLQQEVVTIEREPANQLAANPSQAFQEQDYTLHLRREEPTVDKQVVPYGAVAARKQVHTEQTNVREQLRKDYVAIDKGNARDVNIAPDVSAFEQPGTATGGSSSAGGQFQGSATSAGYGTEITDLSTLANQNDAATLAGKRVDLSGVKVQAVLGPRLVAVSSGGRPIYVVLPEPNQDLREGSTVSLKGRVEGAQAADTIAQELSGESAHALTQQPFFIKARSVKVVGQ